VRRHPAPAVLAMMVVTCWAGGIRIENAHAGDAPAPFFVVKGLDGKTVRYSDFKGKPVVVDFWATWCGPCKATMPHLDAIQERHRNQGLIVVGLSVDDIDSQAVRKFADHMRLKFRLGMADERVMDQFGPIRSIPTTIFINKKGRMVRRVVGYIDEETMESYALELFQE